jgi:hypothetical protein
MRTTITVRARCVGFHHWPDAPGHRSYLAVRHRHEFHVTVCALVMHDDRDIEFHDLKDALDLHLPRGEQGGASCEVMAKRILHALGEEWPARIMWVDVAEDGECGARVEVDAIS